MENTEQVTQLNEDLVAKQLSELEEIQKANEIIANIPTEFTIDGKTIGIKSKSIKQMVAIDRAILELHKAAYSTIDEDLEEEELWEATIKKNETIYRKMAECLFSIINDNTAKAEFTIEWIEDNISLTAGELGEQIIDAYNYKCSTADTTVKKMLLVLF
jgi:hypothetical protein